MKLLIVDDDMDLTRMIARVMEHRAHSVQTCATPFGVSALVLRDTPDLIVLDVMMPGLDGPHLAALLANLPLKRRPQIVLWSAMPEDELRRIGVQAGLPTVPKTTPPTELAARLEKLVSNLTGRSKL